MADGSARKTVVVASNNAHKIVEIAEIMSQVMPDVEFRSMRDAGCTGEADENGLTFEENAFIKADYVHDITGLPAIADDSGLMVDALGGEPGVFSARYAGEHGNDAANNAKLAAKMADVPEPQRTARFVSCVAFVSDDVRLLGRGTCEGRIGYEERGSHGFGYDPLFLPDDTPGLTMAELTPDGKNAISHRRHALEALVGQLGK